VDGVHRAAYVHLEKRRGVAKTEGVDTGGVVDDSAISHGVEERTSVEDVAVHGLGSQGAKRARAVVGAGQRLDCAAGRDKAFDDRAPDEAGTPGNECRLGHLQLVRALGESG
jgi:hypothetical protein